MKSLIYLIVVILLVGWLLGGFAFHINGDAVHLLVVIAIIFLLYNLFARRRSYSRRR